MPIARLVVDGRLTRDPESTEVGSSTVCNFSIAHNRKVKGEEQTDFYNISAWGKLGELCAEHLGKGRAVMVDGSLSLRSYEKDGQKRIAADIRADNVHFLDRKGEGASEGGAADDDDDLGF